MTKMIYDGLLQCERLRLNARIKDALDVISGNDGAIDYDGCHGDLIDEIEATNDKDFIFGILHSCIDELERIDRLGDPSPGFLDPTLLLDQALDELKSILNVWGYSVNIEYSPHVLPDGWQWLGAVAGPDGYNGHAYLANVAVDPHNKKWVLGQCGRFSIDTEYFDKRKVSDFPISGAPYNFSPVE